MLLFFTHAAIGQQAKLSVGINKEWLQPDDTLEISATYQLGDKKLPPATLALTLRQNDGPKQWQLRWPMIDRLSEASIVLPENMPAGKYTLYMAVQPRFFRVYGTVFSQPPLKELDGSIVSGLGQKDLKIPVEKGTFTIKNILFENDAMLVLRPAWAKWVPAISIEAWLDSAYSPVAATAKEIAVGLNPDSATLRKINSAEAWQMANRFADPWHSFRSLDSMGLSPLQQFDSLYVPAAFKQNVDTVFNCMENPAWSQARDIDAFLGKALPGFGKADITEYPIEARYNGNRYTYYLDGFLLTNRQLQEVRLADIAMIKIMRPPFYPFKGQSRMGNGGVALFSRRGRFTVPDEFNHTYRLKGYQPQVYELPM